MKDDFVGMVVVWSSGGRESKFEVFYRSYSKDVNSITTPLMTVILSYSTTYSAIRIFAAAGNGHNFRFLRAT